MRRVTNDEHEIRHWAATRGAHPIERGTRTKDTEPAQLDFVFGELPPEAKAELHLLDWSTFFAMFHLMGLVLAYEFESNHEFELLKTEGRKSGQFEGKPLLA